jgi:hypothetical protein
MTREEISQQIKDLKYKLTDDRFYNSISSTSVIFLIKALAELLDYKTVYGDNPRVYTKKKKDND